MTIDKIKNEQEIICKKYGVSYDRFNPISMIGISKNFNGKNKPINGLRHPAEKNTSGWYIWSGEDFSDDLDFFAPLHAEHLGQIAPEVLKYLGLPPGWRFLLGEDNYVDVWEDKTLLDIG